MTRFFAAVLIASLMLGTNGCETRRAWDHGVATMFCAIYGIGFGIIGHRNTEGENSAALKACRRNLLGSAAAYSGDADSGAGWIAPPGVTRTGEMLLAVYGTEGRVTASEFSEVTLAVPYTGADVVDVSVTVGILGEEFEAPDQLFESMEVTLRTAENGPENVIATASANLTDEEVGASVGFLDVAPEEGLEVALSFAGGAVRDSTVLVNVGSVSLPDGAGGASTGTRASWDSPLAAEELDDDRLAPTTRWMPLSAFKAVKGLEAIFVYYRASGSIKANKFPKMTLDLPADGRARVKVEAGLSVTTDKFKTPKAKELPKSVNATLFTVRNGATRKVGTSKSAVDKYGAASLTFKKVDVPPDAHLRVVFRMKGRKVKNALVMGYAAAGP